MSEGSIAALWVKRAHRGPMDAVEQVELAEGVGIQGNADIGGRRQVTLLEREIWEKLTEQAGGNADPGRRRANVLVEGISLVESRGRRLRLGDAVLEIRGETKPCEVMDAVLPGLKDLMWPNWGGGAYAQVTVGGTVRVGDEVSWES